MQLAKICFLCFCMVVLCFSAAMMGCSNSKQMVQPTDTITIDVKKYGVGGGFGKVEASKPQ